jgi:hypothetical protein
MSEITVLSLDNGVLVGQIKLDVVLDLLNEEVVARGSLETNVSSGDVTGRVSLRQVQSGVRLNVEADAGMIRGGGVGRLKGEIVLAIEGVSDLPTLCAKSYRLYVESDLIGACRTYKKENLGISIPLTPAEVERN